MYFVFVYARTKVALPSFKGTLNLEPRSDVCPAPSSLVFFVCVSCSNACIFFP